MGFDLISHQPLINHQVMIVKLGCGLLTAESTIRKLPATDMHEYLYQEPDRMLMVHRIPLSLYSNAMSTQY